MNNLVLQIKANASNVFTKLGFKHLHINAESVYENEGGYHKLTFVGGLNGFVIEWAPSFDKAQNNMYEDGDFIPISLGERELMHRLENILFEHYGDVD